MNNVWIVNKEFVLNVLQDGIKLDRSVIQFVEMDIK